MGLMALHIIKQGKIPLFFYGQGYVGSLEALLASPLFLLFGASRFTLRLSNVLLYTFFLLIMYKLTSILFSKRLALFTLLVLCFGSDGVLSLQLSATGGHPDMLCVGSGLLLYSLILARSAHETPLETGRRGRVLAYAGWGLLAGLALWVDPLLFPYVVLSGCLLWRFCFYELRLPVALCLLCCFFLPPSTRIHLRLQHTNHKWHVLFFGRGLLETGHHPGICTTARTNRRHVIRGAATRYRRYSLLQPSTRPSLITIHPTKNSNNSLQHGTKPLGYRVFPAHADHSLHGIHQLSGLEAHQATEHMDLGRATSSYRLLGANIASWKSFSHPPGLRNHLVSRIRSLVFSSLPNQHAHRSSGCSLAAVESGCSR